MRIDSGGSCAENGGKNGSKNGSKNDGRSDTKLDTKRDTKRDNRRDAGGFFKNKCLRKLREMGAPISGWECEGVEDLLRIGSAGVMVSCDLCGNKKVRYLHYMEHPNYESQLCVGCICAGILEGDELAAQKRERDFKNRVKRKDTFLKRKWRNYKIAGYVSPDIKTLRYRGIEVFIRTIASKCLFAPDPSAALTYPSVSCKNEHNKFGHNEFGHNECYEAVVNGDVLRKSDGAYFESFDEAVVAVFEKVESTNGLKMV